MHPLLRARMERQLGLFTAAQARLAGYQNGEIRHLLSSGEWVRVRRGVYASAERLATTPAGRYEADCLAVLLELGRPTATISHASAARLWGVPVRRDRLHPLRLTDPVVWRRGQDYRMTEATLSAEDVVQRGPIRLTARPRTLVDCAREWDVDDAVVALDAALLAEHVTTDQLQSALLAAKHWPGAPRAGRALSLADGRAESPLESRGRLRLIGSGLAPTDLQMEIRAGTRLVGVVDAWYEEAAVAVEFDGRVKYENPWRNRSPERVLWEEKRREDDLRALDIRVVRIVDADLGARWPRTEQRLREYVGTPGPARRRFTATARTSLRRAV